MVPSFAFLSGSPGWGELVLLFLVVLVLFGPRRLPEIARMIGRVLEEMRRASQEFRDNIMNIERDAASGDARPPVRRPADGLPSGLKTIPGSGRTGGEQPAAPLRGAADEEGADEQHDLDG
jgi:TatA/E family protein of Tat protein translocase